MVDKRCPMCGKTNPPDAEVCIFCHARLTPVNSTSQSEGADIYSSSSSEAENKDDIRGDQSDWLDSLRGEADHEPVSDQEGPDDWLSGFRNKPEDMVKDEEGTPLSSPEPAMDQEATKEPEDWLRSILPQEDIIESDEPEDIPVDDADWLSRIGSDVDRPSPSTPDKELPDWPLGKEADALEWTEGTQEEKPEDPLSSQSSEQGETELPDWLSGEGEELPDWLSQTTEEMPAVSPAPQAPIESDTELPDWLTREGESSPADKITESSGEPQAEDVVEEGGSELPDWLSGESEELPDWLSEAAVETPAVSHALEESDTELPDWLSGATEASSVAALDKDSEALQEEQAPDIESGAELPDWLSGEGEELPDWLSEAGSETPAVSHALEKSDTELPDWLSGAAEASSVAALDKDSKALQEEQAPDIESGAELPDWLSGEGEELPDWLSEAGSETPAVSHALEESDTELPDWLSGAAEASSVAALDKDSEALQEEQAPDVKGEAEVPDWLSGEGEEIPDWLESEDLSGWASEEKDTGEGVDFQAATSEEMFPATGPESEFEVPDWLGTGPTEETSQEKFADSADTSQFGEAEFEELQEPDEDLTWLEELETAYPEMPTAEEVSTDRNKVIGQEASEEFETGFDETLPGWLTEGGEISEEELLEEPSSLAEGEDLNITPAKLPSWLEAMRPVGMIGERDELEKEIAERPVEGAGPLAGLRGVLPAEPEISQTVKPPVYTVKLQVTDLQKTQADLLSHLIEQEGAEKPIPGRPIITTQHVLRLVIAALLILAILLPVTTGLPQTSVPTSFSGVSETSQLIMDLPAAAPVLLAVDYEPGLSGEMDAISSPVLDHLMIKGAFLTLVSTTPTGAMQAEGLIAQVNHRGDHQYRDSKQYVNMGFIPGGTLGLLAFAESPSTILPVDLNGVEVWGKSQFPALQNVHALADFSMVIVATENPDTARAWIEQVQPHLAGKPMILLLSAQAEPMLRPYYEAVPQQVQGFISGLAASASYETYLGGRIGSASQYWPAFSLGMLVAGLLIVSGGFLNAVSSRLRGSKESQEGEK